MKSKYLSSCMFLRRVYCFKPMLYVQPVYRILKCVYIYLRAVYLRNDIFLVAQNSRIFASGRLYTWRCIFEVVTRTYIFLRKKYEIINGVFTILIQKLTQELNAADIARESSCGVRFPCLSSSVISLK